MLGISHICRRFFSGSSQYWANKMKIAIIGQSLFGAETYSLLRSNGHKVVGVFTVPDVDGKPDPLAAAADKDGVPVFKFKRWRLKGKPIEEVVNKYTSVGAELNVLPFCSQFIPMNVIDHPTHGSIIYHPSILPRHRGASAINWTLMSGDKEAGFTIFWADDGLDTGPILLQRKCDVKTNDTVDDVYNRFLYPEGIKAMSEAVQLIADGKAPRITQPEEGATYEGIMRKSNAELKFNQSALDIHNFIRGNDKVPGVWANVDGQKITFYGSTVHRSKMPSGQEVKVEGMERPAIVHKNGMILFGNDGKKVNVKNIQYEDGSMRPASKFGLDDVSETLTLTDEELQMAESVQASWHGILNRDITDETDFFKSGAGSMDVVRLVEDVRQKTSVILKNEDVYMATTFAQFIQKLVRVFRGLEEEEALEVDYALGEANGMQLKMPHQLFINNQFLDSSDGVEYDTINPANESVICKVSKATVEDVDEAVEAAKEAFYNGPWASMNPRDKGRLMYKLADLMEQNQEELAAIESLDSGAVYTLALKTHVGMSIQTFRYFAGWCDKIHGSTIPINHAHPNRNLTYTKRESIADVDGVLKSANGTEYGLASGVFTNDISKAMYVSDKLDAGTVFVNTYNKTDIAAPFGGFKQSGFGKDLGEEALNEYLKTKAVTVEY